MASSTCSTVMLRDAANRSGDDAKCANEEAHSPVENVALFECRSCANNDDVLLVVVLNADVDGAGQNIDVA